MEQKVATTPLPQLSIFSVITDPLESVAVRANLIPAAGISFWSDSAPWKGYTPNDLRDRLKEPRWESNDLDHSAKMIYRYDFLKAATQCLTVEQNCPDAVMDAFISVLGGATNIPIAFSIVQVIRPFVKELVSLFLEMIRKGARSTWATEQIIDMCRRDTTLAALVSALLIEEIA